MFVASQKVSLVSHQISESGVLSGFAYGVPNVIEERMMLEGNVDWFEFLFSPPEGPAAFSS